ncbi:shikimate dehydrogenase [Staphylococcus sp. 11261D007BR]
MNFAVIGYPIKHSLSPMMHHANFKSLNLQDNYEALAIAPEHFHHIRDIITEHQLDGFNVTIPHKERIIPFLDDMSEEARLIGAVNTVKIENHRWIGYNTDGYGYVKGLKDHYGDLTNARILILGAGGASKGIAYALNQQTKEIVTVANRTMKRFDDWQFDINKQSLNEVNTSMNDFDIIINTTPLGMDTSEESILTFDALDSTILVSDIVYTPLETEFLRQARLNGNDTFNGLDMFVYQGAKSFQIWTGHEADTATMKETILNHLNKNNR